MTAPIRDEQVVSFKLGEGLYGIDINTVREIITWSPVTKVPRMPEYIKGLINLRGSIIPVVDLRKRFRLEKAEVGRETRVVVVENNNVNVGLVVDAVSEVRHVSADAMVGTADIVANVLMDFIRGVAQISDQLVILLDVDSILKFEDQAVSEKSAYAL